MSVDAADFFEQVPELRPAFNVGCLLDIPVGRYYQGKHGESILNAGLQHVTGVCGRGNSYKSTLSHWLNLTVLNRYGSIKGLVYDTEFSLTNARLLQLAGRMDNIAGLDLFEMGRLRLTDGTTMGNDYWEQIRKFGEAKFKAGKSMRLTTPFIVKGENLTMLTPTLCEMDSMSQMNFDSTENINEKAQADSKDQNAMALRDNLIKSRILGQMPNVTSRYQMYTTVVAHMGDDLALDPYAPPQKKLATMKAKLKFKKVPENFTFLTNNLYYCYGATPHQNQADKTPYYPKDATDRAKGDQDLQRISVQNLRAKSGPSGVPIEIIVSQTEGLLPTLTELHFLRANKEVGGVKYPMGFGIQGNDRAYALDILPEVSMSRTSVRGLADTSYELRRAMEITSEMAQMQLIWKQLEPKYRMTPEDLRERLIALGYDMTTLLNTRGYWVFEEDEHYLPFLSTMDLLRMANAEYHPYWLTAKGFKLESTVVHLPIKTAIDQPEVKKAA